MKKFLIISTTLLSSCSTFKLATSLASDEKNHRQVIIVDKWSLIDTHELKTYPIKDQKSFAIGFQELGKDSILYGRDYFGDIYDSFDCGDTITVVIFTK